MRIIDGYCGGKDLCGYFPLYDNHLPKQVNDFLEIGISTGHSIKMFRNHFEGGNFYAMNMNWGGAGVISKGELEEDGFTCFSGDQKDIPFLESIKNKFDVIVEDGSHHSDTQIITFKTMFLNNLRKGGLYVMEDLHCCLEDYWWCSIKDFKDTALSLFREFENSNSLESLLISKKENRELCRSIDKIILYDPVSEDTEIIARIAFIFKR